MDPNESNTLIISNNNNNNNSNIDASNPKKQNNKDLLEKKTLNNTKLNHTYCRTPPPLEQEPFLDKKILQSKDCFKQEQSLESVVRK